MHSASNTSSQQPIKNTRSSIKKQQKKNYIRNWVKARNNTSEWSREKFTHKEVKYDYQLEDYLRTIRNPAHRISRYDKIESGGTELANTNWEIRK